MLGLPRPPWPPPEGRALYFVDHAVYEIVTALEVFWNAATSARAARDRCCSSRVGRIVTR